MAIASDFLQSLVPISQFNKGQAAKIFDRLRSEKELIVLKNNQPSAIILSPEEYTRLTEIEEDYFLLLDANLTIQAFLDLEYLMFPRYHRYAQRCLHHDLQIWLHLAFLRFLRNLRQ